MSLPCCIRWTLLWHGTIYKLIYDPGVWHYLLMYVYVPINLFSVIGNMHCMQNEYGLLAGGISDVCHMKILHVHVL